MTGQAAPQAGAVSKRGAAPVSPQGGVCSTREAVRAAIAVDSAGGVVVKVPPGRKAKSWRDRADEARARAAEFQDAEARTIMEDRPIDTTRWRLGPKSRSKEGGLELG